MDDKIEVNPIYFEVGSATISESSFKELDQIVSLMQAFSNIMTKILINKPRIDEIIRIITLGIRPNLLYLYKANIITATK